LLSWTDRGFRGSRSSGTDRPLRRSTAPWPHGVGMPRISSSWLVWAAGNFFGMSTSGAECWANGRASADLHAGHRNGVDSCHSYCGPRCAAAPAQRCTRCALSGCETVERRERPCGTWSERRTVSMFRVLPASLVGRSSERLKLSRLHLSRALPVREAGRRHVCIYRQRCRWVWVCLCVREIARGRRTKIAS
jgi:hypothetical protein